MKNQLKWFVLITKPKAEKKVAQRLKDLGLEVYCPIKVEVRQWSDRKKKVEVPALPSMLFVKLEEHQRNIVFNVVGVLRYLFWLGEPAVVPEREIDTLKNSIDSGFKIVETKKIEPGHIIEIDGFGALDKTKGKVKHVSGNQIWVILEGLGYVLKLTI